MKAGNPLKALPELGQAVWLDYIRRSLITSGELKRLVEEDGLRGVTSNPAIFEKAITGSTDYSDILAELQQREDLDAKSLYEQIAVRDIQAAADVLRTVYDATNRRDGYVSIEVSPYLAHHTDATLDEARRLWNWIKRENVMIKVPATPEGIPAIRQLISEGINVNVTLLFAQQAYEAVAEAYISGVEALAAAGGDVGRVASVASFFISRIDSLIDGLATAKLKASTDGAQQKMLNSVIGKVAIANAKLTYQRYKELFGGDRWKSLAGRGAQSQRVLWASTSTKNPSYRDVVYVEELVGSDTVNTIPPATFDAFRDHGKPRPSLEEDAAGAATVMEALERAGISMVEATDKLLKDAVRLFAEAFDKLLSAVDSKCKLVTWSKIDKQTYKLPAALSAKVKESLEEWQVEGKVRRLWARDASLWTNSDEANWLGWLHIADHQMIPRDHLINLAKEVKAAGFKDALLLGMGGSSLCPEVFRLTFGKTDGYPDLHVLDSTDPAQIKDFESRVDLSNTICIVSSKSGGTLEPNIFKQYFYEKVKQAVGADEVGNRFIAVTDPGSKMQQVAEADTFRHVYFGLPSIGGRYSALSNFGIVPGTVMGLDVFKLLDLTEEMVHACSYCVPIEENPGVILGTILGVAHNNGRDKVTIVASPGISDLGAWLEQLLAESTGKEGRGLIPVDREQLGKPEVYGNDRVFAYLRLDGEADAAQDSAIDAIEAAGHPVVRIAIADRHDVGQEFFRWEIATAVAGSIIGINAFNQPDVEASKVATKKLTTQYEETGSLPPESPFLDDQGIKLFTDAKNAADLKAAAGADATLGGYIKAHLGRIKAGDYFAVLGYIQMNQAHDTVLQAIRHAVRDKKRVATCLGFGPRFLHSTGQAYKGGPNSGVFLQITCDDATDIQVPGQKYTFGVVKAAQARGDFEVLAERNRRALRVHLGPDVKAGLATLKLAIDKALA
jgi:transaldolase/glucose-6-phosphate isomerase